jgi:hypothetical protein
MNHKIRKLITWYFFYPAKLRRLRMLSQNEPTIWVNSLITSLLLWLALFITFGLNWHNRSLFILTIVVFTFSFWSMTYVGATSQSRMQFLWELFKATLLLLLTFAIGLFGFGLASVLFGWDYINLLTTGFS